MLRHFLCGMIGAVTGYLIGAIGGYWYVALYAHNVHDKEFEALVTGFLMSGPFGAVICAIVGVFLTPRR